jgi:hypothetical protein
MRGRSGTNATQSAFSTVRSEGGLLPPDLLARIAAGERDLGGNTPDAYGLAAPERLNEATSRAWERVKSYWAAFKAARESIGPGESGVTETREQWLLPLFRELGYGRLTFRPGAEEIDGRRYTISHQAGTDAAAPPLQLVSYTIDLERPVSAGAGQPRTSPHGAMQEYLNRTDHLWGVVSNGLRLRLLRDNLSLSRAAYVEFDLAAMLDGGVYADFVLLYLLLHRSRLPMTGHPAAECWLERWRKNADERGKRALDELRTGVETAIRSLGQGLIEHPENLSLREQLVSGRLTVLDYYRQLLRLVYRLLFLLAAEERDLLFDTVATETQRSIYSRHYGVGRLRTLVELRRHADRHDDLWRSLIIAFNALTDSETGGKLGLKPLAGGLFGADSCPDLDRALIANSRLLEAVRGLSFTTADTREGIRRINYRDMDVEELGSVYEGLLELQPVLTSTGERPEFTLGHSGERKSTGSYYTNPGLVRELIVSALEPVIADALARGATTADKRRNLLALNVCDPACGSGHFLLAAARRIGREIARIDARESEPDPETARHATREAIANCVYGVDLNPLAVDLCKLALWLEAHEPGKPIGFLDHHIKQGNSLIGATEAVMTGGIPDDVFEPVTGDDKKFAAAVKKRNRQEKNQIGLDLLGTAITVLTTSDDAAAYFRKLDASEDSVSDVEAKAREYRRHQTSPDAWRKRIQADLWTAAAFWPLQTGEPEAPTQAIWLQLSSDPHLTDYIAKGKADPYRQTIAYRTVTLARRLARRHSFFHWELEFEDVFTGSTPGFDCILGNPPWERPKLQDEEFFAKQSVAIENAPNAAARKDLIEQLRTMDDAASLALYESYVTALRESEVESKYFRKSGSFPLTGRGDVNTYSLFSELMTRRSGDSGYAGFIVPTGIATDDNNKYYFQNICSKSILRSLYDFQNSRKLFEDVNSHQHFSLLTIAPRLSTNSTSFSAAFGLEDPADVSVVENLIALDNIDIALFNPNTLTCPMFGSTRDALVMKHIYRTHNVLSLHNDTQKSEWNFRFATLFHAANDSSHFRTKEMLEQDGFVLNQNCFSDGHERLLPLFDPKMTQQFNHRASSLGFSGAQFRKISQQSSTEAELRDPNFTATPLYWVPEELVNEKIGSYDRKWLLGFKDVTGVTSLRIASFAFIPFSGVVHKFPLVLIEQRPELIAAFAANMNSLVIEFVLRNKFQGLSLSYFYLKQLPMIAPSFYSASLLSEITERVVKLTYTSNDMTPFARDFGVFEAPYVWDPTQRMTLRAELDGIFAQLYNLSRDEFTYLLDRLEKLKNNDQRQHGEYRTKRLCLEAYDRFEGVV